MHRGIHTMAIMWVELCHRLGEPAPRYTVGLYQGQHRPVTSEQTTASRVIAH